MMDPRILRAEMNAKMVAGDGWNILGPHFKRALVSEELLKIFSGVEGNGVDPQKLFEDWQSLALKVLRWQYS